MKSLSCRNGTQVTLCVLSHLSYEITVVCLLSMSLLEATSDSTDAGHAGMCLQHLAPIPVVWTCHGFDVMLTSEPRKKDR